RGAGPSGAVGKCRRWQAGRDPCLHAAPQAADRTGGPIALKSALRADVAARIRSGIGYFFIIRADGAAPGFGDVELAFGAEREATGAVEPAHDALTRRLPP